jgi:LacI family transcriptional regulator
MRELGYKPNRIARSLVSNQTYKIGVIVPNISSSFFTILLESIEYVLWQHNYHMILSNTGKSDRREQDILDIFEEDRIDGVMIFGSHLDHDHLTNLLRNQRAAVVFNGEVDPSVAGQILMNQTAAIEMAVQHLLKAGRCHLGYIGVDRRTYSMRERRRAFEEVLHQFSNRVDGWVMDSGTINLNVLLPQYLETYPQTDGIVCFNDETAAEALQVLCELGKSVPDDIAVIGYDDVRLASLVTPKLTTLRLTLTISELGELAARMLLERIGGKVDQQPCILTHELIVRDSTP